MAEKINEKTNRKKEKIMQQWRKIRRWNEDDVKMATAKEYKRWKDRRIENKHWKINEKK